MSKKGICIALVLVILIGITVCKKKEKTYPYGRYTRQEVLTLFHQNRDLFDELVDAILEDEIFLENGNVCPDGDTWVTPGDDRHMKLFSERSQGVIQQILGFKPYMISYKFGRDIISITFVGDGVEDESFSFRYLVDQSDLQAIEKYIKYCEQDYYVRELSDGWIFTASPI